MIVLPYGDTAVLIEVDDPATILGLRDALVGVAGVDELVPAARTLLVRFDARTTSADALGEIAAAREPAARPADAGRPVEDVAGAGRPVEQVEVPVRYDGADLDGVAATVGCSVPALIERHSAAEYVVAFCGFAPGFAYLTGLDPALHVPRLASPRTSVPAGSVAIAGEYTGVYPRSSPGGWRLLGHTDEVLWDLDRTPPALLTPGTSVRFRPR